MCHFNFSFLWDFSPEPVDQELFYKMRWYYSYDIMKWFFTLSVFLYPFRVHLEKSWENLFFLKYSHNFPKCMAMIHCYVWLINKSKFAWIWALLCARSVSRPIRCWDMVRQKHVLCLKTVLEKVRTKSETVRYLSLKELWHFCPNIFLKLSYKTKVVPWQCTFILTRRVHF